MRIGDVITLALDGRAGAARSGFASAGPRHAARALYREIPSVVSARAISTEQNLQALSAKRKKHRCVKTARSELRWMTYVVTENCIKCKYMDCVEVCPVDCFYEGENMLVIHPDECIDCGVCEPECPADAIKPDTEPGLDKWLQINTEYASNWPNITVKREPPADAKEFDGVPNKFDGSCT